MTDDSPDMTLAEAKQWLRAGFEDGRKCPCCGQRVQLYKRSIHTSMARDLITLWRTDPTGQTFHHLSRLSCAKGGDAAKLVYWKLIEEEPVVRPDGGRAGYWRITENGSLFVRDVLRVPKHAYTYDHRCLRMDGPLVGIRDCINNKFNYRDLMNGTG